jgi:hypothetical protein
MYPSKSQLAAVQRLTMSVPLFSLHLKEISSFCAFSPANERIEELNPAQGGKRMYRFTRNHDKRPQHTRPINR